MNSQRIDDLVDVLGDNFSKSENVFVIRNQLELFRYVNNPEQWKAKQLANMVKYRTEVLKMAKDEAEKVARQVRKVYLLAYKEVDADNIEITKTEVKATIPKSYAKVIAKAEREAVGSIIQMANVALKTHTQAVRVVSALATPDKLYDVIKRQTLKGINKGLKIVYKNGRQMNFKSYMEMNVRTTASQEITNQQIESGAKLDQVFYMCDSYGDSAPDHAPYQGKMYYNADSVIDERTRRYISDNHLMSMQDAIAMYGLTTRPNCRHKFHLVPSDVAMSESDKMISEKYGFDKGAYKGSNYEKMQQQRYLERGVRKYKEKTNQMEKMYNETKDDRYLAEVKKMKSKTREWQGKTKSFVDKNHLKRDYDRESIKAITDDLGARYDIRKETKRAQEMQSD